MTAVVNRNNQINYFVITFIMGYLDRRRINGSTSPFYSLLVDQANVGSLTFYTT